MLGELMNESKGKEGTPYVVTSALRNLSELVT